MLGDLPQMDDPSLLVGLSGSDDAAVYQLSMDIALVQSVDYFTPIVDDPYSYGAIAAANSLSDLYAMGAQPLIALNIVGFPVEDRGSQELGEIMRGGFEKMQEAGVNVVGGHTINDEEPKFGFAVTGTVHPDNVVTNGGAKIGDALIITKPIGTGVIAQALKAEEASKESVQASIESMTTLNDTACDAMLEIGVNACTDVTGFGFIGHLREMLCASSVGAVIYYPVVPQITGAFDLAYETPPLGSRANLRAAREYCTFSEDIPDEGQLLLCDSQTSGGLLIAVRPEKREVLLDILHEVGTVSSACVGEIIEDEKSKIEVVN